MLCLLCPTVAFAAVLSLFALGLIHIYRLSKSDLQKLNAQCAFVFILFSAVLPCSLHSRSLSNVKGHLPHLSVQVGCVLGWVYTWRAQLPIDLECCNPSCVNPKQYSSPNITRGNHLTLNFWPM